MAESLPPEPLLLVDVKRNLRYTANDQDEVIQDLIVAARDYIEGETGLVLTPRTLTETASALGGWIDLSSWPVTSVNAIRYSVSGVMTLLPSYAWQAGYLRRPVRIIPAFRNWGTGGGFGVPTLPVEIVVEAGFASPDDVPTAVKRAMQMLIAHWWANRAAAEVGARAAAIEIPFGVTPVLRRLKRAVL